jgi:lipoprotein-releasing system permease protein
LTPGGYEGFVALRYLRGRRKQTAVSLISFLSTLGIAVGVAALIIALAIMSGFQEEVRRQIVGGNAQLTVFGRALVPGQSSEVRRPGEVIETVEALEGVEAAAAFITGFGVIFAAGDLFEYAQVQGVNPRKAPRVVRINTRSAERRSEGPLVGLEDLAAPTESGRPPILLGDELALQLGVARGDVVKLYVLRVRNTPWGPVPRPFHFEVIGTFRSGFADFDSQRAYLSLESARRVYGLEESVSWVSARLAEEQDVLEARRHMEEALGPDYTVVDIIEQNREFFAAMRLEKLLLFLAVSLIVAVGALGIVTTLLLMVMEKVRDIGALVAMGATPAGITRIFLYQGLIVGLVGSTAGALLGTSICWVMTRWRLWRLDPEVYYIEFLSFLVRPTDVAIIMIVAFVVSLLATLYPSWKAARLDPVQALRHE